MLLQIGSRSICWLLIAAQLSIFRCIYTQISICETEVEWCVVYDVRYSKCEVGDEVVVCRRGVVSKQDKAGTPCLAKGNFPFWQYSVCFGVRNHARSCYPRHSTGLDRLPFHLRLWVWQTWAHMHLIPASSTAVRFSAIYFFATNGREGRAADSIFSLFIETRSGRVRSRPVPETTSGILIFIHF